MTNSNQADNSQAENFQKPEGAKAGWRLLEATRTPEDKLTTLRRDRVQVEDREELVYIYCERSEAVIIVPVTPTRELIMIRQYRYPVDAWCLEVPAGGTHDTGESPLEDVVRKELKEEVGATCSRLEYVTWFYSSNSLSDEKCHVYLALDVELSQETDAEQTEQIEIQTVPIGEALELARNGHMKTGPCALAVLLCEPALRRSGYLSC